MGPQPHRLHPATPSRPRPAHRCALRRGRRSLASRGSRRCATAPRAGRLCQRDCSLQVTRVPARERGGPRRRTKTWLSGRLPEQPCDGDQPSHRRAGTSATSDEGCPGLNKAHGGALRGERRGDLDGTDSLEDGRWSFGRLWRQADSGESHPTVLLLFSVNQQIE